MTKPQRTILFSLCFLLFVAAAPAIVFYSQGYRIDWENKSITKTGGFFAKVWPKQVNIYLDGKLEEKTDFFFGSTLIQNLLPKKYTIKIAKNGYFVWEKVLKIDVKQVNEAKSVILFPQNMATQLIESNVHNFWVSENQAKIALQEDTEKGWNLKLYDSAKGIKIHVLKEGDISSSKVELLNLWFVGDAAIEIEVETKEKIKKYSIDITKTPSTKKEIISPELPSNVIAYKKSGSELYYLDNKGFLYKISALYDEKSSLIAFIKNYAGEKINEKPFKIQEETKYEILPWDTIDPLTNQKYTFLKENNTLYQLNYESGSFEKFFENLKELSISPDGKKIMYYSDSEIYLLFVKDIETPPQRKAGEKILLMKVPETMTKCLWINSFYLVFATENNVKAIEIDNRDRINTATLLETKNPEIIWNGIDKKIYFLSEGKLYSSESLLP